MKRKLTIIGSLAAVGCICLLGQGWVAGPDMMPVFKGAEARCIGKTLKDGKLMLDWRRDTPHFYPEGTQVSTEIWREVYGCSNGVVVLQTNIVANYRPATTTSTPEKIEWP